MPAPLSIFKEHTEVPAAALVAPAPKKSRAKGVAVPKLNLNPLEEDTPPQAPSTLLKLPTFQAKSGSKKLQPISVSSSGVAAPAPQPE
jgi:hypothetical protein